MADHPSPVAVNRVAKLFFFDDGEIRPFSTMIDGSGEETNDPDEARFVVVMVREDCWLTVDLDDFEKDGDRSKRN